MSVLVALKQCQKRHQMKRSFITQQQVEEIHSKIQGVTAS